ncbi:MAG: PfkB family carbohydrate kinase [Sciscionella sp.]
MRECRHATSTHEGQNSVLLAGLCTIDLVQRVTEIPAPGEKVQSLSVELAAGGPATNAAVAVAVLGGRPRLLTGIGRHPLAEVARADLASLGVSIVDLAEGAADPPAVSAVSVRDSDGERTVVAHNAAAARLDVPQEMLARELAHASAVLLDGHHQELAIAVARAAGARGIPIVVDAGSWRPVFTDLLPLVDVCACSASFRTPDGRADGHLGPPVVTRTHGAGPVHWHAEGRSGEVDVPPVHARDTAGAGDVWHGALVNGIATLGRVPGATELPDLIRAANDLAARRIAHPGPRRWTRE